MSDEPLVKVVVTTYNRCGVAKQAIDSVLAQSHRNLHLVIVDDASTDGTSELIRGYQRNDPSRITAVVKVENRGVADSIRTGIAAGPRAPYIAFLDDDDVWHPELLQRELAVTAADPSVGMVCADAEIIDPDGHFTGGLFSDEWGWFENGSFEETLRGNRACASTLLIDGELAEAALHTLPQETIVWDYCLVMLAAGLRSIVQLQEPLARCRKGGISLSQNLRDCWCDTTSAREAVVLRNPKLQQRLGGRRRARRVLALRAMDDAIWHLRARRWRDYAWQARASLRHRSVRAGLWLAIHTFRTLLRPASTEDSR
jgi:glycosyltransferase involved in cell wall biosynthesis